MKRLLLVILVFGAAVAFAQAPADPWFSTFSIVAVDPTTGDLGVGVQSRAFGAGAAVPYAKPGVGAVATQASANRQYGPKAIALLEQGLSPAEVVKRITDEDSGRDTRQVAVIDARGRSAVYTGRRVIDRNQDPNDPVHLGNYAGHVTGVNFSAQGNTLASEAVLTAMAAAYEASKATMAERLMDALDAGQSRGGDTRGMQSAGILVVRPLAANSESTVERIVDIRVDDAENPFVELRRLLDISMGVPARLAVHAAELGKQGRHADAVAELRRALAVNPRAESVMYALAQELVRAGRPQEADPPPKGALDSQIETLQGRAHQSVATGQHARARDSLEQARRIAASIDDQTALVDLSRELGDLELQEGLLVEATRLLVRREHPQRRAREAPVAEVADRALEQLAAKAGADPVRI